MTPGKDKKKIETSSEQNSRSSKCKRRLDKTEYQNEYYRKNADSIKNDEEICMPNMSKTKSLD